MIRKTGRRASTRYSVRCTQAVAEDMCKFEGSLIISRKDEHRSDWGWDALSDKMATWTFEIEGTPSFPRWYSFGRVPEIVEVVDARQ